MSETESPEGGKPTVAVVFGGRSSEHAVSCMTAQEVLSAIDRDAYDVIAVGITPEGRWVLESADRKMLPSGELPSVDSRGAEVVLRSDRLTVSEAGDVPRVLGRVDVVFPLLHGPWGEDGALQGLLEMAGVRYVGAGVLASAAAMDKVMAKVVFSVAALPQLPYTVVKATDWQSDPSAVRESIASLHYPVFVKPARAGSSMGGTFVRDADALDEAVAAAQVHDPKVVVEAAAVGAREIECGVLATPDGGVEVSAPGEIKVDALSGHQFYDFEAKYLDGTSHNEIPADLSDEQAETVREWAVRAFEALGCEGLARVDFFLLRDGRLMINEVNTMPGFTPYSMFPQLWAHEGLSYRDMVDRLLRAALGRTTGLR